MNLELLRQNISFQTETEPPGDTLLSASEDSVVSRLADAWNEFILLESVHDDHVTEFRRAIQLQL